MPNSYLLDPVQILYGSNKPLTQDAVFISNGEIKAFGQKARKLGKEAGFASQSSTKKVLAPCLVDPHSILEEPLSGRCETLISLRKKAAKIGYGQLALLPRSSTWRDKPETLKGFVNPNSDVSIHLWGAFSKEGKGVELSSHAELLKNGAIGLAEDDEMPPCGILQRGLNLKEMGRSPVLLAPRDRKIQGNGITREGVETLRAGWLPDPLASETLPLGQLLELYRQYPETSMTLMNISTATSVSILSSSNLKPMASVCWWHLIKDTASLSEDDMRWRVIPSLGGPNDRLALIQGLKEKCITAIAVHAIPLDEEESKLPLDKKFPGLSGHELVLPLLWQELVIKNKWSVEQLWEALSFGPSKILNQKEESLTTGSRRWLLFDPEKTWTQKYDNRKYPFCANQPLIGEKIVGKVIACGLRSGDVPND